MVYGPEVKSKQTKEFISWLKGKLFLLAKRYFDKPEVILSKAAEEAEGGKAYTNPMAWHCIISFFKNVKENMESDRVGCQSMHPHPFQHLNLHPNSFRGHCYDPKSTYDTR